MKRMYLFGLVLAAALLLASPVLAQNLVVNGGFDAFPTSTNNGLPNNQTTANWNAYPNDFSTMGGTLGWSVEWVFTDQVRPAGLTPKIEIQRAGSVAGANADSAPNWCELDSDWTGPWTGSMPNPPYRNGTVGNINPDAGGEAALSRIYQDLNTILPGEYKLEFAFAARPGSGSAANNQLIVNWDGEEVFNQTKIPTATTVWQKVTLNVNAYSTQTRLSFAAGGPNDSHGTYLDTVVVTRVGGDGCTYTQGYWKTHSKHGPASLDETWNVLLDGGDYKLFFATQDTWYNILMTPPKKGNAYLILAHQYIAAWLNLAKGAAAPPTVETAMIEAYALLSSGTMDPAPSTDRQEYIDLADLLSKYNEGSLAGAPGHCGVGE